jgi:hypothetical protein
MAPSVLSVAVPTPVNPVAEPCTPSSAVARQRDLFRVVVNDVINRSGVKAGSLAAASGYSEFQFSRIRNGESGALDFPDRLPDGMAREIAREYAELHGWECTDRTVQLQAQRVVDAFNDLALEVIQLTEAHLREKRKARR